MSELSVKYNQWVKSIEFFPYEWSANLLAVCLKDQVKIYSYEENHDDQVGVFAFRKTLISNCIS